MARAFCLRRNNHLNDMVVDLEEMFKDENMVDVALSCEEGIIKAHKIILSACSTYFRKIFSALKVQLNNQYPIIIIKDMSYQDLKYIIDFIYRGEITVPQQHLDSVLRSAEALKIKGLVDVNDPKPANKSDGQSMNRKKKKKRRKTAHSSSQDEKRDAKSINSSEDVSEYSDEDDSLHNSQQLNQLIHPQSAQQNSPPVLALTEIEPSDIMDNPSRLLEQTMITGDTQNIQSIAPTKNQNKYPQYLLSSVKQMMYDDSSGLLATQLGSNEQTSNHNLNLAQFDESGTLAGPSSILLQRPNEEHSFNNSTSSSNHNSAQVPLVPTNTSTQSSISNQSASSSLLPMQIPSLGNISASLPTRSSSLAFNFDSLSTKHQFSCPVCYKTFSEKGVSGMNDDGTFDADQILNTSPTLGSANALSQLNMPHHNQSNIPGGEEILTNQDGTNKPKRTYQCNFCLKRFDIRYSLQRHLKVIHDPQRHLFTCNVCSKKFAWKSAFLRHVNVTCNSSRQARRGT